MRLPPVLADLFHVQEEVPDEHLARRLAEMAGAKPPWDQHSEDLWLVIAEEIRDQLVLNPPPTVNSAEAVDRVTETVMNRTWASAEEWDRSFPHESRPTKEIVGSFVAKFVPGLAEAGCFELTSDQGSQ